MRRGFCLKNEKRYQEVNGKYFCECGIELVDREPPKSLNYSCQNPNCGIVHFIYKPMSAALDAPTKLREYSEAQGSLLEAVLCCRDKKRKAYL